MKNLFILLITILGMSLASCEQEDDVYIVNPGDDVDTSLVDTVNSQSILCDDLYGSWLLLESVSDQMIHFVDTDSTDYMIYSYEVTQGSPRYEHNYTLGECNGGRIYYSDSSNFYYDKIHQDTLVINAQYLPSGTFVRQE